MTTKNIRVAGYLPPEYHQKLRTYMAEAELSESAALVRIVKEFFDGQKPESEAIATVRSELQELRSRVMVLEKAVASGGQGRRPSRQQAMMATPKLEPQTEENLTRRLGTSVEKLREQLERGDASFKIWSKGKDPASRAWEKKGDLFHPVYDR